MLIMVKMVIMVAMVIMVVMVAKHDFPGKKSEWSFLDFLAAEVTSHQHILMMR